MELKEAKEILKRMSDCAHVECPPKPCRECEYHVTHEELLEARERVREEAEAIAR